MEGHLSSMKAETPSLESPGSCIDINNFKTWLSRQLRW